MQDIFVWMTDNAGWLWWAIGLVLLAGEMLLPGVYLLWLGGAAMLTGVFHWLFPGVGFEGQGLVFSILGASSIYLANRYFYSRVSEMGEEESVNIRGHQHVGKHYEVITAITNGRGKVKVGDSQWLAEGDDADVGDMVEVVDIDGSVLKVTRLN